MARVVRYDLKTKTAPDVDGYIKVVIDAYSDFSPDVLKQGNNLLTNIWEFSKVYPKVREQKQTWWNHGPETHILGNKITTEYWNWRKKGMTFNRPVRYANGASSRNKYQSVLRLCETELDIKSAKASTKHDNKVYEIMDHVEARRKLIYPSYIEAVKKENAFTELKAKVDKGAKVIIYDVDGPLVTKQNGVKCINGNYVDCTKENIIEMLNSKNHTFGAGFCLAIALLGKEEWLNGK
jgi:hypothetical protein